ncbi:unnamed protein product [Rotaria sordida]|uniref:Methyltransferase FkbM domain-containing protein n=1 Tax=Rotaria sordida TaxID=392033 RepID=A0A815LYR2_9BILA|nr:unnamed protein product [Rotaria sordida]
MNICQQKSSKILGIAIILGAIAFFIRLRTQEQLVGFQSKPLQVWYTAEQRFKRPFYINRDHGFCGPCPEDKQLSYAWRLVDIVAHISPKFPFIVNIGAASIEGGRYDPTYSLLSTTNLSFGALLIDPITHPSFFNAYPNRSNIQIRHDAVWPESVVKNIFEKYNISKNFTILKIDIDSYECSVIESILHGGFRPLVIHTEFNPIFPPPIIFMPIYNSTAKYDWKPPLWSTDGPFYGCSLSALSKLFRPFNYILLEIDFWDAIYIQYHIAQSARIQVPANDDIAYKSGFSAHTCLPYCRQNIKLYNKRIETAIRTASNLPNFTVYMTNIIDLFAPVSSKTNVRHPYIITS